MPHLCNLRLHVGLPTLAKDLTMKTLVVFLSLEMVLHVADRLYVSPILLLFISLREACKILIAEKWKGEVRNLFDGHESQVLLFDFEPILTMIVLIIKRIKLFLISKHHEALSHPLILKELSYR